MDLLYSPQSRAERLIATGRVVLAASSLFAIWLDPSEPAKYAQIAYVLLICYLVYSLAIAALVWRSKTGSNRQRLLTHGFDLSFFTLFMFFTAGPASPFTAYFVFSLVCATLRWQWRGTLWTALIALAVFLGAGVWFAEMDGDSGYELHRLIIRGVYLAVVAALLGYLGAHEAQTRREMALLASWPQGGEREIREVLAALLAHAARALSARRVLLVWADREEPWSYVATWDDSLHLERTSPDLLPNLVASPLAGNPFLGPDLDLPQPDVLMKSPQGLRHWSGRPLAASFRERHGIRAALAVPVSGDSLEGWFFALDKPAMTSDHLVLAEVVAGTLADRLDHFHLGQQLQEAVATEERLRLARDLHDGVLQSLTGIGLRVAAARARVDEAPGLAKESLDGVQRLIALEQRDLRFFIRELRPALASPPGESLKLSNRISELVHRMELEWGLRIEVRAQGLDGSVSEPLTREVYHVIREALVNAVRHGEATAVRVEMSRANGGPISVSVSDNGHGFPFAGRYSHEELIREHLGPRTLLERVAALQGTLSLESSGSGARLEIVLPLAEIGA